MALSNREKLFLTNVFSFGATNPYRFIISQRCVEYLINILKLFFMNPDGNSLHVYCYFQKKEWKNLRGNSDNHNVALAYKSFIDKSCLEANAYFSLNV